MAQPTSGNDILNYQGNADLGLGGSPAGIAAGGVIDSKEFGQTARDVAMLSFQRNQNLYKQRIEDRNKLFDLVNDDKLTNVDILDQDRKTVDTERDKLVDIFDKYNGDILKPEVWAQFMKQKGKAMETVKQAQKNYLAISALQKDKASQARTPTEIQQYDDFIGKQMSKDFWDMRDPYTKAIDFNLDHVQFAPIYQPPVVELGSKKNGWINQTSTTVDLDKTFSQYRKNFLDPDKTDEFKSFVGHFISDPGADRSIADANARLKALGVEPLGIEKDKNGNWVPTESLDRIAAKLSIKDHPYTTTTKEFAKEASGRDIELRKLVEERYKTNYYYGMLDWDKNPDNPVNIKAMGMTKAGMDGAVNYGKALYEKLNTLSEGKTNVSGTILVTPDQAQKLTSEELKILGTYDYSASKKAYEWKPMELSDGEGFTIDPKTGVIEKVKVNTTAGGHHTFDKIPGASKTDVKQMVGVKMADQLQLAQGNESNQFNDPRLGAIYDWMKNQNPNGGGGGAPPPTTDVKVTDDTMFDVAGQTMTAKELKKMGYKDEDIQTAIKYGNIKIK